ncbi:hypothetical protein HYT92_01020 [Candidatus Pacearchaeota archaeon]|nr:hypothetical protein [Candidatus Pacearchaeota archaeon]
MEKKHEVGEVLCYLEGSIVLEVKIVENNSDAEWERYKLKVFEVVKEARVIPTQILHLKSRIRKGSTFTCEKSKESICCGSMIWHLLGKKKSEALKNALKKDKEAVLVWAV